MGGRHKDTDYIYYSSDILQLQQHCFKWVFCVLEGTHSVIQYLDFHSDHELHDSYRCAIIIITKVGLSDLSVFCESISLLLTVDDFWNA